MACTGHCNQCAAHPGYVGPVSTTWTDNPLVTQKVDVLHWNELRNAIDAETTRRSDSWTVSDPSTKSIGNKITDDYKSLRDQLYYLGSTTETDTDDPILDTGKEVLKNSSNALMDQTDELNAVCICDCNYACTCDCNYPCTCNCAHSCLCNCNYSGTK